MSLNQIEKVVPFAAPFNSRSTQQPASSFAQKRRLTDQLAVVSAYGRLIRILEPVDVAHLVRVTGIEERRIILAISRLIQAGFLDPADVTLSVNDCHPGPFQRTP